MDSDGLRLDAMQPGQTAIVQRLMASGLERRRLMDLGILPGTHIEVEMKSPMGDPTAYLVRGALIALRREQARQIEVVAADHNEEPTHGIA